MKKQLSSVDLNYLVRELQVLKDSRIAKIYQPEKESIILSLYKTNIGKKLLKISIGKFLAIDEEKESYETMGFGMLLRKHLDGYFLTEINQIEPDRIIKMSFRTKDDLKFLYLEFFGKGNAILCDENNVIINALEHHDFRERSVRPKLKYTYPLMAYNLFEINGNKLKELLYNSKKDSIVTCLAVELGLGGVYSEEIFLLSGIDKNSGVKDIIDGEVKILSDTIKKILNKKIDAQVILQDKLVIDFAPFELKLYEHHEKQKFDSFSQALVHFYSQFKEVKETESDKKIKSLQRIIVEQKASIEKLREEEKESREKGELIYHKYSKIKEILDELNKASKKYSWKEVKDKLKGHEIIKDLNEKDRKIVVEM